MEQLINADLFGVPISFMFSKLFPSKTSLIRKLSFFGDKEGKTRVIGIMDYWSQTCLKPLHDSCISSLKRIKSDCTFDQGAFLTRLPIGQTIHSLDLHAATDRIPAALTERMLSIVIGKDKSKAWFDIMSGYDFTYRGYITKYSVGQPMGAYSSWPCGLALIHHCIVRIAAARCGLRGFNDYSLLGDDIMIWNDDVAKEYTVIMSALGVEVTESKTFHSDMLCEFAKRNFYLGEEVTAFSASGLVSTWKRYYLLTNFLLSKLHMDGILEHITR
jgi:hypothetical protein